MFAVYRRSADVVLCQHTSYSACIRIDRTYSYCCCVMQRSALYSVQAIMLTIGSTALRTLTAAIALLAALLAVLIGMYVC
jgi:hypothetical protein